MKASEIWKYIPDYEEMYQISSFGRVKSLERYVPHYRGGYRLIKERILKQSVRNRKFKYLGVTLCDNGVNKSCFVHQLVAMGFLNHKPNGYKTLVVDHIDFNRVNNRLDNIRLVTSRENVNQKHLKSTSKYVGVSWCKRSKQWLSCININGKQVYLGKFNIQLEASKYYENALYCFENGLPIIKKPRNFSSRYKGVSWCKDRNKWMAIIRINGKLKNLGRYKNEIDPSKAYQKSLTIKEQRGTTRKT